MTVSTSSLLRAGGATVAVLLPGRIRLRTRVAIAGAGYAAGSNRAGLQLLSVSLDDDRFPAWVNRAASPVTGTASWLLAQAALLPAVRRLPVPRPVAAIAYGGLVLAADRGVAKAVERARAKAATVLEQQAATPEPEPALNG
jgi:hypothetical protein